MKVTSTFAVSPVIVGSPMVSFLMS